MADKPQYAKPASQVDLERRLENGNRSDRVLSTSDQYTPNTEDGGRTFLVEGNDRSQYVGTSPEYANYANETEKPDWASVDESAETKVAAQFVNSIGDTAVVYDDEGKLSSQPDEDEDETDEEGVKSSERESQADAATAAAGTAEEKAENAANKPAAKKATSSSAKSSN